MDSITYEEFQALRKKQYDMFVYDMLMRSDDVIDIAKKHIIIELNKGSTHINLQCRAIDDMMMNTGWDVFEPQNAHFFGFYVEQELGNWLQSLGYKASCVSWCNKNIAVTIFPFGDFLEKHKAKRNLMNVKDYVEVEDEDENCSKTE